MFSMLGFFMSNITDGMKRHLPPNNDWTFTLPMPDLTFIPLESH